MTKKTAVLFVLIFTFLVSSLLAGCGANQTAGSGAAESAGTPSGESAGDSAGQQTGSVGAGKSGQAEQSTPGGSADPGNSAKKEQATPSIPDTNESAVSNWGVANAGNASGARSDADTASGTGSDAAGDQTSSTNSDTFGNASAFSRILVDRDDLFFAIKDAKADAALGYSWKVYIENRTDKNLMFSFEKVAVNDVMCDPFWAEVVAAGKKGNCEITWMRDSLEERGIAEVAQVDFTLNVYNDDDYMEAPLMHDPFTVRPLGDGQAASSGDAKTAPAGDAQTAPSSAWQPAESDQILVNNDDCQIVVTGFEPDNSWGYAMHIYLCNKTDRDLIFSVENTSVNGIMCEPFWAEIVTAGKSAISTILWDKASLSENRIEEVNEITLPMKVYSDKNVSDLYVDESFTLKP